MFRSDRARQARPVKLRDAANRLLALRRRQYIVALPPLKLFSKIATASGTRGTPCGRLVLYSDAGILRSPCFKLTHGHRARAHSRRGNRSKASTARDCQRQTRNPPRATRSVLHRLRAPDRPFASWVGASPFGSPDYPRG